MNLDRHSSPFGRIFRQDWPKILVGTPLCFFVLVLLLGFGPLLLEQATHVAGEVRVRALNVEDAANLWAAVESIWSRR